MRRLLFALGSLMVVAATPAWASEVYVIETSQGCAYSTRNSCRG